MAKAKGEMGPEELAGFRKRFRPLVLQNPNYFGNLVDSVFQPQVQLAGNTTYESIGCVGYHPHLERLHAVVFVNQQGGYSGGICSAGSKEYVRFYLSYDGGASWVDEGVSSFVAHDVPENETRLEYAVTRRVDPPRRFCLFPNLIQARAILSWQVVPPAGQPDWVPVWGEVHDTNIEVEPRRFFPWIDLLTELKVKLPPQLAQVADLDQQVSSTKKALSLGEKAELYAKADVGPARFAFTEIAKQVSHPAMSQGLSATVSSTTAAGLFGDLNIDLSDIDLSDLFDPTDGNTSFERLECVGYDAGTSTMVGVLRTLKPNGYSGGPCTAGSTEYVAFWADTNGNGTYETYLGTATVDAHDYADMPKAGLEYSVQLSVDLAKYQRPCTEGARLIPIRAILSWESPPPPWNPNHVPTWGNREDTVVLVAPGPVVTDKLPVIASVGDMAVPDIDASGYATGTGVETGFAAVDSPFGGRIDIAGKIVGGTPGTKYRVLAKPQGAPSTSYAPITVEPSGLTLTLVTVVGSVVTIDTGYTVHADADGYYTYEDYSSSHFVDGNILMRWFTGAAEHGQAFDLRVDTSIDGNPLNDLHSEVVTVRIDNEAPEVSLTIDIGAGVECADFEVGDTFTGTYSATDEHFRSFWFEILPPGPANGVLPTPASGTSVHLAGGTIPDPGVLSDTWTLVTAPPAPALPMKDCGYSLTLWADSRTNVNSGTSRHHAKDSVGFCLRLPGGHDH